MNEPNTMTRKQVAELVSAAEAEEATWKDYNVLDLDLSIKPNGECYIWQFNYCYASLKDALKAINENCIKIYQNGLKTYSRIADSFDKGQKYDEYFTEENVKNMRISLGYYPTWIKLSEENKLPTVCNNCLKTVGWLSIDEDIDLDNMPYCFCYNCECKTQMKFCK